MQKVNCIVCGNNKADLLYKLPDFMLDRYDLHAAYVKCQICGLIYQNPRLSDEEVRNHYPPEYDSYIPQKAGKSWLSRKSGWYGVRKRCEFITKIKKHGRLLDVGCANGDFLHEMQDFPGWKLHGVEISTYASEMARVGYALDVFNGSLEEARYPDETFDVITLWEVLEHLENPKNAVEEIHRILKIDGVLVLRIPNSDSWDARQFGRCWAGYDSPRHRYAFNPETIKKLLLPLQFKIDQMNCRMGSYSSFAISIEYCLKSKGWKAMRINRIKRLLQNPIVQAGFAPFIFFRSLSLLGPTLTVVAHKSNQF
jgi:2-polyprenyl-3-methyl-5-hydroxy-6-metoxy-1,4-benzoquinol methylase